MKRQRTTLIAALFCTLTLGAFASAAQAAEAKKADKEKPTVAILYFDYQGKDESMGLLRKGLAQMLISDLSELDAVQFVERDRIQDLMEELKLNQSKKIDKRTANKMGRILGARYLVLGGYFDLMGTLRVDARVVEVETSRVIKSTGSAGKVDEFLNIEKKVADDLEKILAESLLGHIPTPKPRATRRTKRPKKLKASTAARYGKALDAIDKGDKVTAKRELEVVVKEQPDFELASLDLDRLIQ